MEAAAALTTTTRTNHTQYGCSCFGPSHGCCAAHGRRRSTTAAVNFGKARRFPARRLRALPPELSEFLSPKLVPGSPSDTGDVSSLIPISAVMLLFYFVSNWVVPAFVMKGLQDPKQPEEDEEEAASPAAAPAASMSMADGQPETKIKVKVKKTKKKTKAAIKV